MLYTLKSELATRQKDIAVNWLCPPRGHGNDNASLQLIQTKSDSEV